MKTVLSIDNQLPTKQELENINNSVCKKCKKIHQKLDIVFVTLSNGKTIWWHVDSMFRCRKM